MRTGTHTPWGVADAAYTKAEGITFLSTPRHGGYHLSADRQAIVAKLFPEFKPFAGAPWYEEDQDCAIVCLAFPDLYQPEELRAAVLTARYSAKPFEGRRNRGWESVEHWLDHSEAGQAIVAQVNAWEAQNGHLWQASGGSGPVKGYDRGCWNALMKRVGDGAYKWVVMTDYPTQTFWTDEELAAVTAQPIPLVTPKPAKPAKPVVISYPEDFDTHSDADPGL